MNIDWASLFKVAGVSLVFGVGIVVLFSIGLLGLSMAEGETATDGPGGATAAGGRPIGTALAGVCFLVCAAAVAFGIWLIVPQFH